MGSTACSARAAGTEAVPGSAAHQNLSLYTEVPHLEMRLLLPTFDCFEETFKRAGRGPQA